MTSNYLIFGAAKAATKKNTAKNGVLFGRYFQAPFEVHLLQLSDVSREKKPSNNISCTLIEVLLQIHNHNRCKCIILVSHTHRINISPPSNLHDIQFLLLLEKPTEDKVPPTHNLSCILTIYNEVLP